MPFSLHALREFVSYFGVLALEIILIPIIGLILLTMWLGTVVLWVSLALAVLAIAAIALGAFGFNQHIGKRKIR